MPVVVIVDDSLTVRKVTSRLLTRVGYEVITAKDGVDALEKLLDMAPDVMLLDVEIPRMDGFELTKQLPPVGNSSSALADRGETLARKI